METDGTGDKRIPYGGGEGKGGPLPNIQGWLGRWMKRDQCRDLDVTRLVNGVSQQSWTCHRIAGVLKHIRIEGHTHGYPRVHDEQIFISPKIVEFLLAHRKP